MNKMIKIAFAIICVIVIILLISFYNLKVSDTIYLYGLKEYSKEQGENKVEVKFNKTLNNVDGRAVVKQRFKAIHNNMEKIIINFSDNNNTKSTKFRITLRNITENRIVKDETFDVLRSDREKVRRYSVIGTDKQYEFKFEKEKKSKNDYYELSIVTANIDESIDDSEDKLIKLKYSDNNFHKDGILYLNDKEINGSIDINEVYSSNTKINAFIGTAIIISIITIGISFFLITRKNITAEKVFLYTVPILCILFIIYIPMFKAHDEQRHWLRVYEISEGHLLTEVHDGIIGTPLPTSVIQGINNLDWSKITYSEVAKSLNKKLESEKREVTSMNNVAIYSPVQYIPQSIGVIVARLFTDKVMVMAYSARVMNAIVCIILLYISIKKMPFGKNIMLLISFIPIVIQGVSCMSADGLTISICFLLISYILNIIYDKDKSMTKKDVIILTIICAIISLCKIVYLPIIGILLLVPNNKFKNKKQRIIFVAFIWIICIIIGLTWFIIANQYLEVQTAGSSSGKIIEILQHPIEYIQKVLYTMNSDGQSHLMSLFGGKITWASISLIYIVPYTLYTMFIVLVSSDSTIKGRFNNFSKIIIFLVILVIIMLIYTSLYLQWTDDGEFKVSGVQGRYYIPILPLIGLVIGSSIKKINNSYKEESVLKTIGVVGVILQVYTILTVMTANLG